MGYCIPAEVLIVLKREGLFHLSCKPTSFVFPEEHLPVFLSHRVLTLSVFFFFFFAIEQDPNSGFLDFSFPF